jgi:RNA polymerase sigma-70 factor (ECF subfamily)
MKAGERMGVHHPTPFAQPGAPKPPAAEPASGLVEHFFRHESGRLVSVLVRVFGVRHL